MINSHSSITCHFMETAFKCKYIHFMFRGKLENKNADRVVLLYTKDAKTTKKIYENNKAGVAQTVLQH